MTMLWRTSLGGQLVKCQLWPLSCVTTGHTLDKSHHEGQTYGQNKGFKYFDECMGHFLKKKIN